MAREPAGFASIDRQMPYYFATTVDQPFDEALAATITALADEGFGIVTRVDMEQTLRDKIGVKFRPYVILGACNPALAHEALLLEDKVGTMLPCNVVVQQAGGRVEIAAIDPVASMQAIGNGELKEMAQLVAVKLKRAVEAISR